MPNISDKHPAGRQPYDPLNGLRIGALAGGILGIAVTALLSFSSIWLTVVGAVVGALVGFWWEKRRWT